MAELEPDRTFRAMAEILHVGFLMLAVQLKEVLPKVVEYWDTLDWLSREKLVDHPWGDYPFDVQPVENKLRILDQYVKEQGDVK